MGKKLIKWGGVVLALIVLVSLAYFVKDKASRPPLSADEQLKAGIKEIRNNRYAAAIVRLKAALQTAPQYADIRSEIGRAYYLSGKTDSAEKYLMSSIKYDQRSEVGLLFMANVWLRKADTTRAMAYFDRYLKYYPKDWETWIRKYNVLMQRNEYIVSAKVSDSINARFAGEAAKAKHRGYWHALAEAQRRQGDYSSAYASYQKALSETPRDTTILRELATLAANGGEFRKRTHNNRALAKNDSANKWYWLKTSAVKKKAVAARNAEVLKTSTLPTVNNISSTPKTADTDNSKHYTERSLRSADRQVTIAIRQKQRRPPVVMNNKPGSRTTSPTPGAGYVAKTQLPIDKQIGLYYENKNYDSAAALLETVVKSNSSKHYADIYEDVMLLNARQSIDKSNLRQAQAVLERALTHLPASVQLTEQAVNAYATTMDLARAITLNERLIALHPQDSKYQLKKVGLLHLQGAYTGAADVLSLLIRQHPGEQSYKDARIDELTAAQRQAAQLLKWDEVIAIQHQIEQTGSPRHLNFQYAIAAYSNADNEKVLSEIGSALKYYPEDSLFLARQAVAYKATGRYYEGISVAKKLTARYPESGTLKQLYLDQLNAAGKYYARENRTDTSLNLFLRSYQIAPSDSFALQNLAAIYFSNKQFDSSIYYAKLGLAVDGNNRYLLNKKASAYEQLKDYKNAFTAANLAFQQYPSPASGDYASYLKSKTYRNQAGVGYQHTFFSTPGQYASITSLQYTRRFNRGTVTGRLSYGDRPAGTGIQGGLDAYYTHNSRYYSNAYAYFSSGAAFPFTQLGYSLFKNYPHDWETELGLRYTGFDSARIYSFSAGVSKYISNTVVSLRGTYGYDTKHWYPSGALSVKQFLNEKKDYLSFILAAGRITDDPGLRSNVKNLPAYSTGTFGLGFQKNFNYRTSLNISGSFTKLMIPNRTSINQYDLYLSLLRNF